MEASTVLVCGLDADARLRLRVHRHRSELTDVHGAPSLLASQPAVSGGLASQLPALCLPDGVTFRSAPLPPQFFTTAVAQPGGDLHLACLHYYERLPPAAPRPS